MKIHYAGKFKDHDERRYVNGLVAYVDGFDMDEFSVHELNDVMDALGYVNEEEVIYYHYLIPGTDLEFGLRALGNDVDVQGLARYTKDNKLIKVYCEHDVSKLLIHLIPTVRSTVVIEELPSETPIPSPSKIKSP